MGLTEKRGLSEIKKNWPKWEKEILAAAGTKLEIEVKWDSLLKEGTGQFATEYFENVFVQPLVNGFTKICSDDIGKESFSAGVKKLVISNENDNTTAETWAKLKGTDLTVDYACANLDYGHHRTDALVEMLTKKL